MTITIPRNFEASEKHNQLSNTNNIRICRGQNVKCEKWHIKDWLPGLGTVEKDYWKMDVDYYDWAGKQRGWLEFTVNEFDKLNATLGNETCDRDEYRKMNESVSLWLYNPERNGKYYITFDKGETYRFRWFTDSRHGNYGYWAVGDDNFNYNGSKPGFRAFTSNGSDYNGTWKEFTVMVEDKSTKVE